MRFVTRPVAPLDDPLAMNPDSVWMSPGMSLWGWGEATRIQPGTAASRLAVIGDRFRELVEAGTIENHVGLPGTGPVVMASSTFAEGSPGSVAVIPEVMVGCREGTWWVTSVDGRPLPERRVPAPPADRARYAGSSLPDVQWLHNVAEAIDLIEGGSLDKVVLARDYAVWSRQPFHLPRLLSHLLDRFPGCHIYSIAGLVGASPELLARRWNDRFESVVLAGSTSRFEDPASDRAAGEELLESKKDLWEHELAVSSVTGSLSALDVIPEAVDGPRLLRLDNVQHLATDVSAVLPQPLDVVQLASALHPTAAVGGTPTPAALDVIARLEGMDRSRYAGPVGWMDMNGDGDFAIALRCAELSGARARLFAGAGIVAGSLPESELEETRIKLAAMMGAMAAD